MPATISDLLEDDLVSAARRRLIDAFVAADAARVAAGLQNLYLGPGGLIGQDGVDNHPAGPYSEAWVFPGLDNEGRPLRDVEGSNKCSVTILGRDHWNSNQHNTMNMPVLRFLIYGDTVRQADGNPAGRMADLRVKKVAKLIDHTFHIADNFAGERRRLRELDLLETNPDGHLWNPGKAEELYVIACLRSPGGGLNMMDVMDNDYAVRGDLRYEVSLRDWA